MNRARSANTTFLDGWRQAGRLPASQVCTGQRGRKRSIPRILFPGGRRDRDGNGGSRHHGRSGQGRLPGVAWRPGRSGQDPTPARRERLHRTQRPCREHFVPLERGACAAGSWVGSHHGGSYGTFPTSPDRDSITDVVGEASEPGIPVMKFRTPDDAACRNPHPQAALLAARFRPPQSLSPCTSRATGTSLTNR